MTAYKIYKKICNDLNILFPFKESEISVHSSMTNSLEFRKRISKKTSNDGNSSIKLSNYLDDTKKSFIYYKIYRKIGEAEIDKIHNILNNLYSSPKNHPDKLVDLHTIISILYLSGYRGDSLISKIDDYIKIIN